MAHHRAEEELIMRAFAFLLLALCAGAVQAAEPLGRLFFTPTQRATLDAGKELDKPRQATAVLPGPRTLKVDGVVTRSDGESTVWVNGAPANAPRAGAAPIYAKPSGNAGAKIRVLESESSLRVGQTLDRRTGRVTEPYERKQAAPAVESTPATAAPPAPAASAGVHKEGAAN
jgi:hypothetical protein